MPSVARFVDEMRTVFGVEQINAQIKKGMNGEGTFWASENGVEVGSRPVHRPDKAVSAADIPLPAPKTNTGKRHGRF